LYTDGQPEKPTRIMRIPLIGGRPDYAHTAHRRSARTVGDVLTWDLGLVPLRVPRSLCACRTQSGA
jgi:hypothetical protein